MALLILFLVALGSVGVLSSPQFRSSNSALQDEDPPTNPWALLVAGSKGYDNYRHQADICHAYQVLHNQGVPDERIVVMMYDDIANSPENPTPGVILNHPHGPNVYRGVPKDYTRDLVTANNFLHILQGKPVRGGSAKIIASGPNDHIFVYFSGHGGPGLIGFPTGGYLGANQFIDVIKQMHRENKFSKMVIYMEACNSGSMFNQLLPDNIDVYVTTAANPHESSYSCYYSAQKNTVLGDEYSVKWMEDSDKKDLTRTSLIDQYLLVQRETKGSHVMMYGDIFLGGYPLSMFQGNMMAMPVVLPEVPCDAVSNFDVPIALRILELRNTTDQIKKTRLEGELRTLLDKRTILEEKVAQIASLLADGIAERSSALLSCSRNPVISTCYENAVAYFNEKCFNLSDNPYALKHLCVFANVCQSGYSLAYVIAAMNAVCRQPSTLGVV